MIKRYKFEKFINILADSIKKKKIGIRELGRNSGIDPSFISKLLKGKRNPPDNFYIEKIAAALSIDKFKLAIYAGRIPDDYIDYFTDDLIINLLKEKKTLKDNEISKEYYEGSKNNKILSDDLL